MALLSKWKHWLHSVWHPLLISWGSQLISLGSSKLWNSIVVLLFKCRGVSVLHWLCLGYLFSRTLFGLHSVGHQAHISGLDTQNSRPPRWVFVCARSVKRSLRTQERENTQKWYPAGSLSVCDWNARTKLGAHANHREQNGIRNSGSLKSDMYVWNLILLYMLIILN